MRTWTVPGRAGAAGVSATAAVTPPEQTVTCGSPAPTFTATGSVTSRKAQTVSYYWSLSDGRVTPAATLTFTRPGTLPAQALSVTPQDDPSSGEAVLVVTKPVAVSALAPYTLSCDVPLHLAAAVAVSPASTTLSSCTAPAPALTFTAAVSDSQSGPVTYHWKLPGGNGAEQTLTFAKAGRQTVTTTYKPVSDSASGSAALVITSPGSVTSNAAAFTVACGAKLTVSSGAPVTATVGAAYSGTVTVSGGKGTYTWGAVSGLPAGLTASASGATLTISGKPTTVTEGAATATVTASDTEAAPKTATATVKITVSGPALVISTTALPSGASGGDYSAAVTAAGGTGAYTWSATGLPGGLTMSATGTISGTVPTVATATTYSVTVTVTDSGSPAQSASSTYSLPVNPAPAGSAG